MKRQTTTEDYLKRTPFSLSPIRLVLKIFFSLLWWWSFGGSILPCVDLCWRGSFSGSFFLSCQKKKKKKKSPTFKEKITFFFFLFFSDVYVKMMKVRLHFIHYECCQMSNLFHIFSLISRPRSRKYTFRSCRNNKSKTPGTGLPNGFWSAIFLWFATKGCDQIRFHVKRNTMRSGQRREIR